MKAVRFVVVMLACAAAFMAARFLIPHQIDGISIYVAVALVGLALLGALVGIVTG